MSEQMLMLREMAEEEMEPPKSLVERTFYRMPEDYNLDKHALRRKPIEQALAATAKYIAEMTEILAKPYAEQVKPDIRADTISVIKVQCKESRDVADRFTRQLADHDSQTPLVEVWGKLSVEEKEEQKSIIANLRILVDYRNYLVWAIDKAQEALTENVAGSIDTEANRQAMIVMFNTKCDMIMALYKNLIRPCWLLPFVQGGKPGWLADEFDPASFKEIKFIS